MTENFLITNFVLYVFFISNIIVLLQTNVSGMLTGTSRLPETEKDSIGHSTDEMAKLSDNKDFLQNKRSTTQFGEGGSSSKPVSIINSAMSSGSSMSPKEFFSKYVKNQQPVVFKQAIQHSKAYKQWSDRYFKQLKNIPEGHDVLVESKKKENRSLTPVRMPFKEFVEIYNLTDQYMVEPVPVFLRQDFILPHHLQCEQLMRDIIVEAFMWFSSGGTSSVVHTDSVENMNCLVVGRKRFVFVSPEQSHLVLFDHPEGSYSGIDVDDVDYTVYPGLADVDFLYADVEAGDCLYIPYKWIHQVRSYDRNIAVNVWWDTFRNNELNLNMCDSPYDPDWSLDRVEFMGFQGLDKSPAIIRDHVSGIMREGSVSFDDFLPKLGLQLMLDENFKTTEHYGSMLAAMKQMFNILDVDKNGQADNRDLEALSEDHWSAVSYQMNVVEEIADEFREEQEDDIDAGAERDEL